MRCLGWQSRLSSRLRWVSSTRIYTMELLFAADSRSRFSPVSFSWCSQRSRPGCTRGRDGSTFPSASASRALRHSLRRWWCGKMGFRARQALRCALLLFASLLCQAPSGAATSPSDSAPAAAVRAILSVPNDELDYGRAKIALDRLIDPSIDGNAILAEIDRLVRSASEIAGPQRPSVGEAFRGSPRHLRGRRLE